ncbi:hypothetical protein NDN08_008042 [Rhodosorus marinus]|uniref:ATP synthase F1 complex delta/epsilon subunit N-terminal domain-containing protein n=1 Tax=Rhodosorus marinus TaxID=101924 RepID=A0AAV8UZC2_9RHOD|nr:hypothetical protein NDN08_008042 [Rhodosorus marinus]
MSAGMLRVGLLRRMGRIASKETRRFMADEATKSTRDPTKLMFNFLVPSSSVYKDAEVDMVVIPAATGEMGIVSSHVPTVAQMIPGMVSVFTGEKVEKYFVSSGYTFIHPDRTDVCAAEAVKLDDVDAEAVKSQLAHCESAMAGASNEKDKAEAQIGVELYSALTSALARK